jgi:uncharacterized protein YxeA
MKTIIRPFLISLLIITGIAFLFTNCHKDKECPAVVTVKYLADTSRAVPNATVKIHKQDVNVQGFSDANGQFRYTFDLEAILDVNAIAPPDSVISIDTLYGQAIIRLVPGQTVYKTVFVN